MVGATTGCSARWHQMESKLFLNTQATQSLKVWNFLLVICPLLIKLIVFQNSHFQLAGLFADSLPDGWGMLLHGSLF
jgi:hypothetical protein